MGVDVGAVDYNLQQKRILTEMDDDRELTPHQLSNLRRRADRKRIEELQNDMREIIRQCEIANDPEHMKLGLIKNIAKAALEHETP